MGLSKTEFLERFYEIHPNANIELIEFTGGTKPCKARCNICGKIIVKNRAEGLISNFNCCNAFNGKIKYERLIELYDNISDYQLLKKIDKDTVLIKHLKCGSISERKICNCLVNLRSCNNCNTIRKHHTNSLERCQKLIDNEFGAGKIQILDYTTCHNKSSFKCVRCGLIFENKLYNLLRKTRGCPECDKIKYKGENYLAKLFEMNDVKFKTQVKVLDLPLQKFDFAIYDNDEKLKCYVELQGDQHFEKREIFKDSLEKIQERDNRKRKYCKENNIPLYEIIYINGRFKNLDILPFLDSTTIPRKGSRPASNLW